MIYGIGIDIVKTERMKKAVDRWGDRFLRRVFTRKEIVYAHEKNDPSLSLSVRFAAKEALIKAIGARIPVSLTDIEVESSGNGRPFITVKGELEAFFKKEEIKCAHLSLSHEKDYGVACVVLEKYP
jgi:holo-[acyl-carrier protein] synthase